MKVCLLKGELNQWPVLNDEKLLYLTKYGTVFARNYDDSN
jgi:hypothetical protein